MSQIDRIRYACALEVGKRPLWRKMRDFISVYRMYAKHHPRTYAIRIAYGIAFRNLPF